jgi:hypothetical protein
LLFHDLFHVVHHLHPVIAYTGKTHFMVHRALTVLKQW